MVCGHSELSSHRGTQNSDCGHWDQSERSVETGVVKARSGEEGLQLMLEEEDTKPVRLLGRVGTDGD